MVVEAGRRRRKVLLLKVLDVFAKRKLPAFYEALGYVRCGAFRCAGAGRQ